MQDIIIIHTTTQNLQQVLTVEKEAFGSDIEPQLVTQLLNDQTAQPVISLLAMHGNIAVGHILFTKTSLATQPEISAYLLAPMAVIPNYQNKGIGKMLINKGFELLRLKDVDVVFVLGHPAYYPKSGFLQDAAKQGFEPPYPIAAKNATAWMVKYLSESLIFLKDKVVCADAISKVEYWVE